MRLKVDSTRTREAPHTYSVSQRDSDLIAVQQYDIDTTKAKLLKLTDKGRLMLQDAMICAAKWEGAASLTVAPFTRWDLGMQVGRKEGVLNPYDLRMVSELIDKLLLIAYRQPLPAKEMVGVTGDTLTVGAGWQYVYAIRKQTIICLLALQPKQRAQLEQMRGAPFTERVSMGRRW